MTDNIRQALELAKKWLFQWYFYYILLVAALGYWIYKDENKITALEADNNKENEAHKAEIRELRNELSAKDCVEQFKVWREALEGEVKTDETKAADKTQEIEAIKAQNQELSETLKFLNNQK